jgi:hypothetical protein
MRKLLLSSVLFLVFISTSHAENFTCDTSKNKCDHFSSCAEAVFYTHICGLDYLDNDGDGFPCERDLCGHKLSMQTQIFQMFYIPVGLLLLIALYFLYRKFTEPVWKKSEKIFAKSAQENGWILIPIDNSRKAQGINNYKRSDFICLNCFNIEIDVKCYKLSEYKGRQYYCLNINEIKRFQYYQEKERKKIFFAFYEKRNGNRNPFPPLRMIALDKILNSAEYKKGKLKTLNNGDQIFEIPLTWFSKGFQLLHEFKKQYQK